VWRSRLFWGRMSAIGGKADIGATLRNVFAQCQSHQARINATTSPTMVKKK